MDDLTIGQLAAAAGVPASTVRFYEREKLLAPDARTGANYRRYSPASLERLRFIRAAQGAGFNLADIRGMLALTHSNDSPCDDVSGLIEHRLADVRARMEELQRVEKALADAQANCCRSRDGKDWCQVVYRLRVPAATSSSNPSEPSPTNPSTRREKK